MRSRIREFNGLTSHQRKAEVSMKRKCGKICFAISFLCILLFVTLYYRLNSYVNRLKVTTKERLGDTTGSEVREMFDAKRTEHSTFEMNSDGAYVLGNVCLSRENGRIRTFLNFYSPGNEWKAKLVSPIPTWTVLKTRREFVPTKYRVVEEETFYLIYHNKPAHIISDQLFSIYADLVNRDKVRENSFYYQSYYIGGIISPEVGFSCKNFPQQLWLQALRQN